MPMDLSEKDLTVPLNEVKKIVGNSLEALFVVGKTSCFFLLRSVSQTFSAATGGRNNGEWNSVTAQDMLEAYQINVIGPILVAQSLIPLLEKGKERLLVNVSTRMASILDNSSGRLAPYRCSKVALNMWTKSLSIEIPWLRSVSYHPGIVATDLLAGMIGAEAAAKNKSPAKAAEEMLKLVYTATSGSFLSWDGSIIPF